MISPMTLLAFALYAGAWVVHGETAARPNFIVILADNLRNGDLGCFGSKLHGTPNIDRMAAEETLRCAKRTSLLCH